MTDGLISSATINNNWAYPTGDLPGCFAAIYTRAGARRVSRVLALSSPYGLPTVRGIDFEGLYPIAKLLYSDPDLPVAVSARAFSPLIPHDIRNSSFPAAAFVYRVRNTSAADVEVCVAMAWENTLGVGGTLTTGAFDDRTGNKVAAVPDTEGFFAQKFTRAADANSTTEGKLRNNATGDMTLLAAPERPQAIVKSAAWNALDKKPGWWAGFERDGAVDGAVNGAAAGQAHPAGVICVRLMLRPRETVELPFAIGWYTPRQQTIEGGDYGHYYQNVWPDSYAAARGLLAEWHSLLALTEEWQRLILSSNMPRWMARRLINSASPITTHSLFTRDESFVLLDSVAMPPGASAGTGRASASTSSGAAGVLDFGLGPRATRPGTRLTSLTHRLVVSSLLTDFFPILSARELRLFMARQTAEGRFPQSLGELDRVIGMPQPGSLATVEEALVLSNGTHALRLSPEGLDDSSAFVLQIAEYTFRTGDAEFLHVYYTNVRRVLEGLLDNVEVDGLPALGSGRLSPASASLYLAALQAGARLCSLSGSQAYLDIRIHSGIRGELEVLGEANRKSADEALARRCEQAGTRAADAFHKRFWNGSIFADRTEAGQDFCAVDQLVGITFADRLAGQGPAEANQRGLLPEANVTIAMANIERLNDPKSRSLLGPIARVPLMPGQSPPYNQEICSIDATILGEAVILLTRRQPESAVALLRRLDETRNNVLLSPWQSPGRFAAATGDKFVSEGVTIAQAVDWNQFAPLEGFSVDLTSGQMALSCQIPGNWRSLAAPIFAPTFWGRLEFRPTARGGITSLRIDRLIALPAATAMHARSSSAGLLLTRLRIAGPPPRPANAPPAEPPVAHVSRGAIPLGVKVILDPSGDFILIFETPVRLTAGDRLEVDLH